VGVDSARERRTQKLLLWAILCGLQWSSFIERGDRAESVTLLSAQNFHKQAQEVKEELSLKRSVQK
jgi:hypothetical protein